MGFFDFIYPAGSSPQLTTAQAFQEQQDGARIIDIRDIIEWNKGHVLNSVHIPQAKLLRPGAGIDKDDRLILVCNTGTISLSVAHKLVQEGYNATSIHGGFDSWKRSGYPISHR